MDSIVEKTYRAYIESSTDSSPHLINFSPRELIQLRNKVLDNIVYALFEGNEPTLDRMIDALVDITELYPENLTENQKITDTMVVSIDELFNYIHNPQAHFCYEELLFDTSGIDARDEQTHKIIRSVDYISQHANNDLTHDVVFAKRKQLLHINLEEMIDETFMLKDPAQLISAFNEIQDSLVEYAYLNRFVNNNLLGRSFNRNEKNIFVKAKNLWEKIVELDDTNMITQFEETICDLAKNSLRNPRRNYSHLTDKSTRFHKNNIVIEFANIETWSCKALERHYRDLFDYDLGRLVNLQKELYEKAFYETVSNDKNIEKTLFSLDTITKLIEGEPEEGLQSTAQEFSGAIRGMQYFLRPKKISLDQTDPYEEEPDFEFRIDSDDYVEIIHNDINMLSQYTTTKWKANDWFSLRRSIIISKVYTLMENIDVLGETKKYNLRELFGHMFELDYLVFNKVNKNFYLDRRERQLYNTTKDFIHQQSFQAKDFDARADVLDMIESRLE